MILLQFQHMIRHLKLIVRYLIRFLRKLIKYLIIIFIVRDKILVAANIGVDGGSRAALRRI